ncbi:hypothetical protein GCM10008940_11770 [Microbulbifer agarilyticus]
MERKDKEIKAGYLRKERENCAKQVSKPQSNAQNSDNGCYPAPRPSGTEACICKDSPR